MTIWIPNNNYFHHRSGESPRWIILHGTAGGSSAVATAQYFQSTQGGANPVSSHYIVGRDGTIVQCVSEDDGAWANGYLSDGHDPWWDSTGNPNNVTISIEHEKASTDNSDTLTDAQKKVSFALIKDICLKWNIPLRKADQNGGITGHFSIDPVNRARCPGTYPWDELFSKGEAMSIDLTTSGLPDYFEAVDTSRWKCKKNGFVVALGILDFYKVLGGTGLCGLTFLGLPLENEQYPAMGIAIQHFERGIVAYDPLRLLDSPVGALGPCYLMHVDQAQQIPDYKEIAGQAISLLQKLV